MQNALSLPVRLRRWLGLAPELPRLRLAITPRSLSRTFHRTALLACDQPFGMPADDLEHADRAGRALFEIWSDYRAGMAQTQAEKALGQALEHIAKAYLED